MNYVDAARERWPAATRVIGDGRYAVTNKDGRIVYLAMTESQQRSIALGIDGPVFEDLAPKFIPDLPDDFEDRQRERRERREEKFRARY